WPTVRWIPKRTTLRPLVNLSSRPTGKFLAENLLRDMYTNASYDSESAQKSNTILTDYKDYILYKQQQKKLYRRHPLSTNEILAPMHHILSSLVAHNPFLLQNSVLSTGGSLHRIKRWWKTVKEALQSVSSSSTACSTAKWHRCLQNYREKQGENGENSSHFPKLQAYSVTGDLSSCYESINHADLLSLFDSIKLPDRIHSLKLYTRRFSHSRNFHESHGEMIEVPCLTNSYRFPSLQQQMRESRAFSLKESCGAKTCRLPRISSVFERMIRRGAAEKDVIVISSLSKYSNLSKIDIERTLRAHLKLHYVRLSSLNELCLPKFTQRNCLQKHSNLKRNHANLIEREPCNSLGLKRHKNNAKLNQISKHPRFLKSFLLRQNVGIPQGSKLSNLLCALYYAKMDECDDVKSVVNSFSNIPIQNCYHTKRMPFKRGAREQSNDINTDLSRHTHLKNKSFAPYFDTYLDDSTTRKLQHASVEYTSIKACKSSRVSKQKKSYRNYVELKHPLQITKLRREGDKHHCVKEYAGILRLPCLFLRFVDDFLFISFDQQTAEKFVSLLVTQRCWGDNINAEKLRANFKLPSFIPPLHSIQTSIPETIASSNLTNTLESNAMSCNPALDALKMQCSTPTWAGLSFQFDLQGGFLNCFPKIWKDILHCTIRDSVTFKMSRQGKLT
ncbi:hypothetical protein IE077_001405, partial [Cardiosporidium cionae]